MMKLDQIVQASLPLRKLNAKLVRVVAYKTGRDRAGLATVVAKTFTPKEYNLQYRLVNARDQNKYVSSIKFLDKKLNVKVSCSCPDFVFAGWEYSLHERGAAEIIYGNGEPPNEKNPEHRPGACKHLLALRTVVKQKHGI
jgi:hypothetical protein